MVECVQSEENCEDVLGVPDSWWCSGVGRRWGGTAAHNQTSVLDVL